VYRSRFTVLRVRGIPIGINYSWLLIAAFLVWSLGAQIFPHAFAGLSTRTYVAMAVVSTLLFFASVVLHELGHAFRALKEGMQIEGITLWLFGGVATFVGRFPTAGAEFRVAVAGPAVSAALAAVFGVLAAGAVHLNLALALRGVLVYLVAINLLLLAFNLVPALPLDGGRILQAFLWQRRGDFASATRATAVLGQGFGLVLAAAGIGSLLEGNLTTGLWLSLLGIFVIQAARSEAAYGVVDRALAGIRLRDLLGPNQAVVAPGTTIADLLASTGGPLQRPAYPVASKGRLLGVVSTEAAGAVPVADRPTRTVDQTMGPADGVAVLDADTAVLDALDTLQTSRQPAAVTDGGRIAGMVSLADVTRALQVRLLRRRASRLRLGRGGMTAAVVVLVAAFAVIGETYHPPFYVLSPGPVTDVSHDMTITINGAKAAAPNGHFLLVTVLATQHTLFGDVAADFHPHRQIIPTSEVGSQAYEYELFAESRVLAAAAAGMDDGMQVTLTGSGALVTGVVAGSPAASVLRSGDIIVGVDGSPVHTEFDLQDAVAKHPAGTGFALSLRRGSATITVHTVSADVQGQTAIGAQLLTKDIALAGPFTVSFVPRNIGGPSAGLVYALAISGALGNLDLHGTTVAATGTIDRSGNIGDVGDVDLKAVGAAGQGAKIFIVPADEAGAAKGPVPKVEGVASLDEALRFLKASGA
jgi:PDZ domain-containing secreted protein/Zn-dependent protease